MQSLTAHQKQISMKISHDWNTGAASAELLLKMLVFWLLLLLVTYWILCFRRRWPATGILCVSLRFSINVQKYRFLCILHTSLPFYIINSPVDVITLGLLSWKCSLLFRHYTQTTRVHLPLLLPPYSNSLEYPPSLIETISVVLYKTPLAFL